MFHVEHSAPPPPPRPQLAAAAQRSAANNKPMDRPHVLLDTDIGDDIDDAFCLALLLRSPEIADLSVLTCYGDTRRRMRCVNAMLKASRRDDVTTNIGADRTLLLKPRGDQIGQRYLYGDDEPDIDAGRPTTFTSKADVALSIGPMTNLALSLTLDFEPIAAMRHLTMGGEFRRADMVEHNIRCDVEAAHHCYASGIPMDVIPLSIGLDTKLLPKDVDRLTESAATDPLIALVVRWLTEFRQRVPNHMNMFDPMTVVAMLHPEFFEWETGLVTVDTRQDERYGRTTLEPDPSGPHRVAMAVDVGRAKTFLLDRLCG